MLERNQRAISHLGIETGVSKRALSTIATFIELFLAGKAYPFTATGKPSLKSRIGAVKDSLDPDRRMNPESRASKMLTIQQPLVVDSSRSGVCILMQSAKSNC